MTQQLLWVTDGADDLVEIGSGNSICVRPGEAHNQRVVLAVGSLEHDLYYGPEARAYLNGLRRALGATAQEDVISQGRGSRA